MEATVRLYTLNYDEEKTYLWAAVFVACNLILPQVFHLIPQGGIIFSPLSFFILVGAYKFGWKTGLLAALASPLVNHLLTGMPAAEVLPVMTMKLAVLALVAGLTAQHFKTISLPILIGVILVTKAIGALGELILTGGIAATIADFTVGWPGLLLQIIAELIQEPVVGCPCKGHSTLIDPFSRDNMAAVDKAFVEDRFVYADRQYIRRADRFTDIPGLCNSRCQRCARCVCATDDDRCSFFQSQSQEILMHKPADHICGLTKGRKLLPVNADRAAEIFGPLFTARCFEKIRIGSIRIIYCKSSGHPIGKKCI